MFIRAASCKFLHDVKLQSLRNPSLRHQSPAESTETLSSVNVLIFLEVTSPGDDSRDEIMRNDVQQVVFRFAVCSNQTSSIAGLLPVL